MTVIIVAIVIPAIALRLAASHDLQLILVVHWCADHVVRYSWINTSWMLASALPVQHHILHIVVSHLVELLIGGVVPVSVAIRRLLVHLVLWLHHARARTSSASSHHTSELAIWLAHVECSIPIS